MRSADGPGWGLYRRFQVREVAALVRRMPPAAPKPFCGPPSNLEGLPHLNRSGPCRASRLPSFASRTHQARPQPCDPEQLQRESMGPGRDQ